MDTAEYTFIYYKIVFLTGWKRPKMKPKGRPGVDVITNLSKLTQNSYAEIKHSNWLKLVMRLSATNESALFQHNYTTQKVVYDTGFF